METKDYYAEYRGKVYVNHSFCKDWICLSYDPERTHNPLEEFKADPNDIMNKGTSGFRYISRETAEKLIRESWKDAEIEFELNGRKCKADKCIKHIVKSKEAKEFYSSLPNHKGNYGQPLHLCLVNGVLRYTDNISKIFGNNVYIHFYETKKCKRQDDFTYFRPIIDVETSEYI